MFCSGQETIGLQGSFHAAWWKDLGLKYTYSDGGWQICYILSKQMLSGAHRLTRFLLGSLRLSCAASTYPALDGGQQVKYLRETHQRKKVKILSSNWNFPNQYFLIKTIPSSKIEGVVGAEFLEPPTSSFLTSSWIGTQVLDIINKYKNRKGEKVKNKIIWKTRRWASCKKKGEWLTDNLKSRDASASKNSP